MKLEVYRISNDGPGQTGIMWHPRSGDWLEDGARSVALNTLASTLRYCPQNPIERKLMVEPGIKKEIAVESERESAVGRE